MVTPAVQHPVEALGDAPDCEPSFCRHRRGNRIPQWSGLLAHDRISRARMDSLLINDESLPSTFSRRLAYNEDIL